MPIPEKDTVSIHFVRAALRSLPVAARGRVLAAAGIPGEWLTSDVARVPAAAFAALWLAVNRELGDEFFGLDRRGMKLGSFALITHGVLHSRDLHAALKRILLAFNAMLDQVKAEVTVESTLATVRIDTRIRPLEARRFAEETYLVMLHGLLCWLAGRPVPLQRIEFGFAKPAHAAEHALMFTHNLAYDAAQTRVVLDARQLKARVVQGPDSVKAFLAAAPQSVLLKTKNMDSWTARLRRSLRQRKGRWPTLEQVAGEFGLAPSTLRRRLEAEGAGFQGVKDDLRRDLAIHQLYETDQTVTQIAASLGFDDASVFRRAFKKWTGARPGTYRQS